MNARLEPEEIVRVLEEERVSYVLIGGYAARLYGPAVRPRTSK